MKKPIQLALIFFLLLLPVLIYLFLQLFGSNRFDLPVYLASENWEKCLESDWQRTEQGLNGSLLIVDDSAIFNREERIQRARILSRYQESIAMVYTPNSGINEEDIKVCLGIADYLSSEDLSMNQLQQNWLILVDKDDQIRGYYRLNELDDIDRLLVELDILRKEDERN
jgi:hypothetical protein